MLQEEWEKATLYQVVNQTLQEYHRDCMQTPYCGWEKDRCGYIGQILNKVAEERKKREGGES